MAHIVMFEAPGGNDFDMFETALALGHEVSFLTADLAHYRANGCAQRYLERASTVLEIRPFDLPRALQQLRALTPAPDALICLVDIRLRETARLAQALGLAGLQVAAVDALRDKFTVRRILAQQGLAQPAFALATSNGALRQAVQQLGLPVVIKPCDGYGSQNVAILRDADDLHPLIDPLDHYLSTPCDYGLGVQANQRLLVERYIDAPLLGCDTLSSGGQHRLLGVHEKHMAPAPSSAILGSSFPAPRYHDAALQAYVFSVLDALQFELGAAHIELLMTADGPMLVEVNARLVGAGIPRMLNLALGYSVHAALLELYLGGALPAQGRGTAGVAATRWLCAPRAGELRALHLPDRAAHPLIRQVDVHTRPGQQVAPALHNGQRLVCAMALAPTQAQAEAAAADFIAACSMEILPG